MKSKVYITLGIILFCIYGLFVYEPTIVESETKNYLAIKVNNENVDINIPNAMNINVDSEEGTNINLGDKIRLKANDEGAATNILGVGSTIEDRKESSVPSQSRAEVSISAVNPMGVRSGNVVVSNDIVLVDGVGIGEMYDLEGQDLHVNGVKNHIKVKGQSNHLYVNGIAMIVRVDDASSIEVNGIGNRVYLSKEIHKDSIKKNGILNFVFIEK